LVNYAVSAVFLVWNRFQPASWPGLLAPGSEGGIVKRVIAVRRTALYN